MRRNTIGLLAGTFFLSIILFPGVGFCKKGGVGSGGGPRDDGIFYHSHSDRSYSGKGQNKGLAKGHAKQSNWDKSQKKVKTKGAKKGQIIE